MTFGFYYASFSIIYWGGGGVGICYASKEEAIFLQDSTKTVELTKYVQNLFS